MAFSRIFFAAYMLVVGMPTFSWVSANPPGFLHPPPLSLGVLFSDFPPMSALLAVDVLYCVLLLLVLVGMRTKSASILLSVTWILGNSFRYGFGKIDHDILAAVTPAVMAFSGWGAMYSVDAKRREAGGIRAWPLAFLALLVAFAFFSAGLPKLLAWADFDLTTHGARGWLISGWYELGRRDLLAPLFMGIDNAWFWEGMDLAAVVFEVGFLFSLAHRTLFRSFILVALVFNLANLLMLNIGFLSLVPVYAMFTPWERLTPRMPRGLVRTAERLATPMGLLVLLAAFIPLYLLVDRISVATASGSFSHLGIAFDLMGSTGYQAFISLAVFPTAAVAALAIAGSSSPLRMPTTTVPGAAGKRVIFFDGVCNLCNGFIDFIIVRDRARQFMYASLQSEAGQRLVTQDGAPPAADPYYSVFLLDTDGRVYERSDAIIRIVTGLGGMYRLLGICRLVPRPLRDLVYRGVARYRYRIFGARDSCRLPTPDERAMFLG